jgi:hypothetical protein
MQKLLAAIAVTFAAAAVLPPWFVAATAIEYGLILAN